MPRELFKHKKTNNIVAVISREGGMVKVQYMGSATTAYFSRGDFARLFQKLQ